MKSPVLSKPVKDKTCQGLALTITLALLALSQISVHYLPDINPRWLPVIAQGKRFSPGEQFGYGDPKKES